MTDDQNSQTEALVDFSNTACQLLKLVLTSTIYSMVDDFAAICIQN